MPRATDPAIPETGARPPLALLVPFFAAFAFFWVVPLLAGLQLSLESNALYGPAGFVGLRNYRALAGDRRFALAFFNTALYASLLVATVVPLGLGLAHLLRSAPRGLRGLLRFGLVVPALTPPVVLAFLFLLVFAGRYGLLNAGLLLLGLPTADWLKDPPFIRVSLLLQGVWRWTGFAALLLEAALAAIPREHRDLATAEGAGSLGMLRHVTLPAVSPVLRFLAILLCLDAFVLFSGAYVLLGGSGGTADAGLLLVTYAYGTAFTYGRFASAAAMSLSLVPVIGLVVWALMRRR
ncbi:MAG TPA: sugar ABC transporter permease [Vicinamibacteria bacterium]